MTKSVNAIRGMNDISPLDTPYWQHLESLMREVVQSYCYQEIRMPIVEKTELFSRSIGEITDIVEKEMYTFEDRNGDSLTLRPEGTAGCVRAGIENGLLYNQIQRLWYMGPMFRHERPQKGRYRQFHQIGVEAFGMFGPDIDAELILLSARIWSKLGLTDVELQLNSLGTSDTRKDYRGKLVEYFNLHKKALDEDSRRRLQSNPLRILDSKNPGMRDLITNAPKLSEYLDEESKVHFEGLKALLDSAGVTYTINPCLVRGLDYYSKTVFEWVTNRLGAQGTVCAGGRYDGLVQQMGGKSTPAAGFAIGLERVVELVKERLEPAVQPHAYMVTLGDIATVTATNLAEKIRTELPQIRLCKHCGGGNMKNQFKKADKSGARVALILGEDEISDGTIGIKWLREDKPQLMIQQSELAAQLKQIL